MDQAGIAYGQGYDSSSCSTASWVSWFKKNAFYDSSFTATPQPGDVIFFGTNRGAVRHAAVVVDYDPQTRTITFVGGNQQTKGGNASDAWGVTMETILWQKNARREVREQYILGLGRPFYGRNTSCRHQFDQWIRVTGADCKNKGYDARSCLLCGQQELRRIAPAGHADTAVVTEPTCTDDGYTTYTCSVCGRSYVDDYTAATGHSGEWIVRTEPTLTQEGLRECECSVCGEFVQQVLEKLPLPYTDITKGLWYESAVRFVFEKGLMNGISQERFAPDDTASRGMLVTILWRMEGSPTLEQTTHSFEDLSAEWYMDAVNWAYDSGVVTGMSDTVFDPDAPITRQQMVAMLYRYCQSSGYDMSQTVDLTGFPDAGQIDDYAVEPMAWAVGAELINGVAHYGTGATLEPEANATRAQMATILMRLCESIVQQ